MLKVLILGAILYSSHSSQSIATPFEGSQIYRTDDRRGDFIVLSGQPNTMAEVSGTDTIRTNTLRKADSCGVGRIRMPEATPAPILRINDETIDYLSLPVINSYSCSQNGLSNNAYNPATRTVYIANLEPEGEFISRIQREQKRIVNLNNCGFGLVPMRYGDGTLYFRGQSYLYRQLRRTVRPPVCRNVNGTWVTYFAIPLGQ